MEKLNVFGYSGPRQFLLDTLAENQRKARDFSVRKWAKEMGLSHALLVMLLQGKRPLKVKHGAALAKGLSFTSQESLYFHALLQYDSAQDPEEKSLCSLWLSELNPGKDFKVKELESYLAISHWIYTALLAMTELREFSVDEENIAKRLGKKVTQNEVRAALERLMGLGLITRGSDGRVRSTFEKVTTKSDLKDAGVIKYHQSACDLAKEAIAALEPEKREFQSFSLCIDTEKMPLAKEMMRKFRAQLAKAVGSECGNEVYQANFQFFQLTESQPIPGKDEGVDTEGVKKSIALKGVEKC
jgi:uncharacterized protein (TIGR02147 family)